MRPLRKPRLFLPIMTLHKQRARQVRRRAISWRIAHRLLQVLLITMGALIIPASLATFFLGPADTARIIERGYAALTGDIHCLTAFYPPGADGTIRSLAPIWMLFGAGCILTGWDVDRRRDMVPILASVMFVGGAGRAMSYVDVAAPHPAFVILMMIEMGAPLLMMTFWARLLPSSDELTVSE